MTPSLPLLWVLLLVTHSRTVSQNRVTLAADVTLLEDATKVVITPPWGVALGQ